MRLEEDDLLSEIMAEEASEHAFLADVMGEPPTLSMPPTRLNGRRTPPSPPASKGGCWDEVLRLGASRRELGGVVARRLDRCAAQAKAALKEATSSDELRAALHGVGLAAQAAGDAERERRALEDESDAIFARLGRPVDGDVDGDGAWAGREQLTAARERRGAAASRHSYE